ncbi:HlyD family efflux transporter periplasmic adaptor subunit [Roseibium hamelinense]|nr:HlyD family efflux transporter periplasmic adaptor subunit [Roseibium hamelinense]
MHHRVSAPMRVTLDEQPLDVSDWSLGGFRVAGLKAGLEIGAEHPVSCTLPFQGFNITFEVPARVIRWDQDTRAAAFRFVDLGDREAALMRHFIEELVRGKMTGVEDTILRIDTPVTPVPTKPDPNPVQQMPVRRWPIKQIVMTLFYLSLGIAVFGYVAIYLFASLFRLEVSSAVVSAERTQITAPVSGQIVSLAGRPDDRILSGKTLVHLRNQELQRDVSRAELDLMTTRAELNESKALLADEQSRAEGYRLVAENNIRQAETQLDGLMLARDAARLKLERYQRLFEKGHVVQADLDLAELEHSEALSNLQRKEIHIAELKKLRDSGESTQLYTGTSFAGRAAELGAAVERLEEEAAIRARHLAELKARDDVKRLPSPFDARIVQLLAEPGTTVKAGEPIMVLEENDGRKVTAFLTQDEIDDVRHGSTAKLYVPSEDRWIFATVEKISRTDGFIDEVTQMHRFRAPDSRSAKVVLSSVTDVLPEAGTPVTVYFERHRANIVFRTASSYLRGAQ